MPIFCSDYSPVELLPLRGSEPLLPDKLSAQRFYIFSGIGDHEGFAKTVKAFGLEIAGETRFQDHYSYTLEDVARLAGLARAVGATALLTTEKDAARWPGHSTQISGYALSAEVRFIEGEDEFMDTVISTINRPSPMNK